MVWAVRRFLVAPAVVGLTGLLWLTLPLWLIAAAALSPLLPGRWRVLRVLWILVVYLTAEAVLLLVMWGAWFASGFGRTLRRPYWEGIHYDLVQGAMWVFFREARRVLRLTIATDGPAPDAHPGVPILVCSRHAGPGDSFTLVHALMHWYALFHQRKKGGAAKGRGRQRPELRKTYFRFNWRQELNSCSLKF